VAYSYAYFEVDIAWFACPFVCWLWPWAV